MCATKHVDRRDVWRIQMHTYIEEVGLVGLGQAEVQHGAQIPHIDSSVPEQEKGKRKEVSCVNA